MQTNIISIDQNTVYKAFNGIFSYSKRIVLAMSLILIFNTFVFGYVYIKANINLKTKAQIIQISTEKEKQIKTEIKNQTIHFYFISTLVYLFFAIPISIFVIFLRNRILKSQSQYIANQINNFVSKGGQLNFVKVTSPQTFFKKFNSEGQTINQNGKKTKVFISFQNKQPISALIIPYSLFFIKQGYLAIPIDLFNKQISFDDTNKPKVS